MTGGAVRAGNLKLIQSYENNRVEPYDLAHDPGEQHDLSAQRPADVTCLTRMLETWRRSVGARMPTPNPDYRGATAAVAVEAADD